MSVSPQTDRYLDMWVWLSRTRDAIFSARRKELHKYGISARQASALFVLDALGDKAMPSEIAHWLLREPHSITEFLKRMEKDGLIERTKDPQRRNVIRVRLTEKGRKAFQKVTKLDSIHDIISVLSEAEMKQMQTLLEKLWYRSLRKMEIERHPPFPPVDLK